MRELAGYLAVRELWRTGVTTVWLARPVGGDGARGGERHVLKVCEPPGELMGPAGAARAVERFLASARAQRAAWSEGGPIAPVYDVREIDGGAVVVGGYFPRSLRTMAVLVRPEASALRRVGQAATGALRAMLATGRVHGNLTPGNVLFTGSGEALGELGAAGVLIDDPAPLAGSTPEDVRADLAAIARLLVFQATGRPYDELRGWPIQSSFEWQRLGADEMVWRRLCHDMLNPDAGLRPTLEQVEIRLGEGEEAARANAEALASAGGMAGVSFERAPEVKKKRRWPVVAGAAAVVMVIGAAVWNAVRQKEGEGPLTAPELVKEPEEPKIDPQLLPAEGEDPRLAWTAEGDLALVGAEVEALSNPGSAEKAPELLAQREKLTAEAAALKSLKAGIEADLAKLKDVRWIVRDADAVRLGKESIDVALADLRARAATLSASAKEYEAALRLEVRRADSLEGFQEFVRARLETGAGLGAAVRPYFAEACGQLLTMQGDLKQLNDLFSAVRGGLSKLEEEIESRRPRGTTALDKALGAKLEQIARNALVELKPFADGVWKGDDAAFAGAWRERLDTFAAASAELIAVAKTSAGLLRVLDEGWMLEETVEGPGLEVVASASAGVRTIGSAWAAIESSPAAREFTAGDLREHGGDVLAVQERVDALRSLRGFTEPDALADRINTSGVSAGEARSAWARLGELGPPAGPGGVQLQIDLAERVRRVIGQRAVSMTRERWAMAVEDELRGRWALAMAAASDRLGVSGVLELREAAGVEESAIAELPAHARYNVLLAGLDSARSRLTRGGQSRALKRAAERFAREAGAMEGLAQRAEVAAVLSGIASALAQKSGITEDDLRSMGPGVRGWSVTIAGDEAELVTYTQPVGRGAQVVTLRQVKDEDAGWVSYVQTTELSVGQFNALTQGERWPLLRGLLPDNPLRLGGGPGTWTVRRGPRGGVAPAARYLAANPQMQPAPPYPEGLDPGAPVSESPVVQVSPDAALMIARMAGCRLPTVDEWRAALTYEGGAEAASAGANLRDLTWEKQRSYIASEAVPQAGRAAAWPDRNAFFSPDGGARLRDAEARPAVEEDDGVLWFRRVTEGDGKDFVNLIGNVNEYVLADIAGIDGLKVDPEAVVSALGNYEAVRVVGASALSDGSMRPDEPMAVEPEEAKQGYADVGVRLAFTAGEMGPPFSEILAGAIGTPVYLRP